MIWGYFFIIRKESKTENITPISSFNLTSHIYPCGRKTRTKSGTRRLKCLTYCNIFWLRMRDKLYHEIFLYGQFFLYLILLIANGVALSNKKRGEEEWAMSWNPILWESIIFPEDGEMKREKLTFPKAVSPPCLMSWLESAQGVWHVEVRVM